MKKFFIFLLGTMLIASCSKESAIDSTVSSGELELRYKKQTFTVRIEAINEGSLATPFAPGVWIVQKKNSAPIFMNGSPDYGDGLEALAEDGVPGILNNSLKNHPKVRDHAMFNTPVGASGPAPIFPGDAYEFSFTAKPNDYLNFATMFVQSNDLFVAPGQQGIPLFDAGDNPISGDITSHLALWDAGTEVNEEPGVGPNQAPRQSGPDTGLDENGVVKVVNDGFTYPAVNEVIRVTITPM